MPELRITQQLGSGENIDGFPGSPTPVFDVVGLEKVISNYLVNNGYSNTSGALAVSVTGNPSALSPSTQKMGDIPNAGVSGDVSRYDHIHGMPSFGTVRPQLLFGLGIDNGISSDVARADHQHGTPTGAAAFTPTGTANNSRNKLVRYVTASPGTQDDAHQNLDNLQHTGTGVTRVTDSQAYGGYAIKAAVATGVDNTLMMFGPFFGSNTNDFINSPGLTQGNYRVTVYCKVGSVASGNPVVDFDAHNVTAGIVQNDGTRFTFNANDLGTGYVGASFPLVLLGDTRGTDGLQIRAYFQTDAGTDFSISHIQIEQFEGLVKAEVTTSFIANLAVTDAKINTLTVAKLTTGTMTADVTQSGVIRTGPDSSARVLMNSTGIFGYSTSGTGSPFFSLTASGLTLTGTVNATGGTFSGTITASGTITGGTISGATLRTAASGLRVEISSSVLDWVSFYTGQPYEGSNNPHINSLSTVANNSSSYVGLFINSGNTSSNTDTASVQLKSATVGGAASEVSLIADSVKLQGTVTTTGTLSEGANRVYTAGNPPPYPVSSVNGFTGAVSFGYVSSFNGSTGAVSGVTSVNGSSGAVSFGYVSSFNGSTGAVSYSAPRDNALIGYGSLSGSVGIDDDGSSVRLFWNGTSEFRATNGKALNCGITGSVDKAFIIDHPDPSKSGQYLHHSCLEGPTADVYYRGEGRLTFFHDPSSKGVNEDESVPTAGHGAATITLPDYFEFIAREEGRTVTVTPILGCEEGCEFGLAEEDYGVLVAPSLAVTRVENGQFVVRTTAGYNHGCASFFWEVKAVRRDVPLYDPEPSKSAYSVRGEGPYTYLVTT